MNTKKMNFEIFFVILYFFTKFEHIFALVTLDDPLIEIAGETEEKAQRVRSTYEKLTNEVNYRADVVGDARIKAASVLQSREKERKLEEKYEKLRDSFISENFCKSSKVDTICKKAFKNSYFENEDLSLDDEADQSECRNMTVDYVTDDDVQGGMHMQIKLCVAKNVNTGVTVLVYLRSFYNQPTLGGKRYFVIIPYSKISDTEWQIVSDLQTPPTKFRFEAYLSLGLL